MEQLFEKLYEVKIFSKLDLYLGYHQIRVKEDIIKIMFRTQKIHFKLVVMLFHLTNTLATFHALMN